MRWSPGEASDPAPPDVPAPPGPDPSPTPQPGDPRPDQDAATPRNTPGEHPLESDETDVSEAQERMKLDEPTSAREPTGQTGSATEQYGGAGSTPDAEPELESRDG